jgi:hypothetical protein
VIFGVSGTYKTCIARLPGPTLDSQFIYLSGPRLIADGDTIDALAQQVAALSASVSALAPLSASVAAQSSTLSTLSASVAALSPLSGHVAALSAALSCGAGGRRLETDASFAPSEPLVKESEPPVKESSTAKAIVDDFLSRRPDLAATLTAEQRAVIEDLGQHFWLPALA